jgi:hypothetical protein
MLSAGMNPPIKMTQAEWITKEGISIERIDPVKEKYQKFRGIKIGDKISWTVGKKRKEFIFKKRSNPQERLTVLHFDEV